MKKSVFFLLLILCTCIWTICSHVFKDDEKKTIFTEDEFIDFLYQNLGVEELHDLGMGHAEHALETSGQPADFKAMNFQLETIENEMIQLSDLKGKKVVLNFWTSWCPPCKEEMPQLNEYYEQYADAHNVEILAINITDQEFSVKDVKQFVQQYRVIFPVLLDETGKVSMDYAVLTIPTTFIINEEGMVVEKIVGPATKEMLLQKLGH